MEERRAKTKAQLLDGLLEKIGEAEDALLSAQKEHDVLVEAVARKTRNDALGQEGYSQAARREDGKVLRDLDGDLKQLTASLETLRHALPGAKHNAAREQLEAVCRGLGVLDSDLLAPALEGFRVGWNRMLGALAEVEKCFLDRSALESEFTAAREILPEAERVGIFVPAPILSHAALRNLLTVRVGDSSRFLARLGRGVIQETDLGGQDRAPVLTVAPDAPATPESE